MNTCFTNEGHRTLEVVDTLKKQRLWIPTGQDYPGHNTWLEKVEADMASGKKRAMVAVHDGSMSGVVIYQRHPLTPTMLEIKNISVMPHARGRHIASFLLRNTEVEATTTDFPGVITATVDTKPTNIAIVRFLEEQGYRATGLQNLYGEDSAPDLILEKELALPS